MVCRHQRGDPSCTSGKSPASIRASAERDLAEFGGGGGGRRPPPIVRPSISPLPRPGPARPPDPVTPDAENFRVLEAVEVGTNLVLKVEYPSCANCSFEGVKVMVYRGCKAIQAIRWTRIDPHFGDPDAKRADTDAPSPDARFPASSTGWQDALLFAKRSDE